MPIDVLARARDLLARGFSVIPVHHPDDEAHRPKDPSGIGKAPTIAWKRFQRTHPTPTDLRGWFGNGRARNLAIVTGAISDLVMVDGDNPEALAWMAAKLPDTPIKTKTAKGEHWGYSHPGVPVRNKARIKTGDPKIKIDVRGDGGYVVAPGSQHATGTLYERIGTWPPSMHAIPRFDPAWIEPDARHENDAPDAASVQDRDDLRRRARAYADKIPPAIEGEGGDTHTFAVLCAVVRGFDLTDDEALDVLSDWNRSCRPPWSEEVLREKIHNARAYGTETIGARAADLVLDHTDPMQAAREFVAHAHTIDDTVTLRYQAQLFYRYDPNVGAYGELDDATVRALLYHFLERAKASTKSGHVDAFKPTREKVANVLDALKAVTNLPASLSPPSWLTRRPGLDARDLLAFPNGLLHVPTRQLHPRTPDFFTLNAIDCPYDPWAPTPTLWLAFLYQLWPNDPAAIETLQEMFGYLLTPDTAFQKIFLLHGPKRSGKGTIARILQRLIGPHNTCNPTLSSFGDTFGRHVLIGKTLAVISDARIGHQTDGAKVAETLLGISGEDAQTVHRKFLGDWNGKLYVRFLILTNELPQIKDASTALASRFVLLAFTESFYGKEDLGLFNKLATELPGILLWALDGRDRLYARGYFVPPASAKELMQELEDLSSPISVFLRTQTACETGADVSKQDLFVRWCSWCALHGITHPGTDATFARNLRAVLPGVRDGRIGQRGRQVRSWVGLRLIPFDGVDPGL
jgi:putative DNA primase/helicase